MAIVLRAQTSGGIALSASPQTITLPATTLLNDCIVVISSTSGTTTHGTMSGAGATWVVVPLTGSSLTMYVGYGCSAGNTTIVLTSGIATGGRAMIGMFTGVLATSNPVRGSVINATASPPGAGAVTPSLTYAATDALIGGGYAFTWGSPVTAPVWSNGATDILIDDLIPGTAARAPYLDYALPSSGTTTTYTSAYSAADGSFAMALALISAPTLAATAAGSVSTIGALTATAFMPGPFNTLLTASSVWAQNGTYSLCMQAVADGSVGASTPTGTSGRSIDAGVVVRGMAFFHSPATPRSCSVSISFYNSSGSLISSATSPLVSSTTTSGATGAQAFISTTTPALTATMSLSIQGSGLFNSELLYADCMLMGNGASTTWAPSVNYDWTSPQLTLTSVERGYNNTEAVAHSPSAGANGTIDLENYAGAPGWSQVLDITRVPDYVLPWLGQFIGSAIPQNTTMSYQQVLEKITHRSGFQRATVASIVAEIVQVINSQYSFVVDPLSASQVMVLENTTLMAPRGGDLFAAITSTATALSITNTDASWGTLGANSSFVIEIDNEKILIPQGTYNWSLSPVSITGATRHQSGTSAATHAAGAAVTLVGGINIYGYDEYALTLLIPVAYFNIYTYESLEAAAANGNYTALNAFITTLGGFYENLQGSTFPGVDSPYINFVQRYRPAGLQIFIGGY